MRVEGIQVDPVTPTSERVSRLATIPTAPALGRPVGGRAAESFDLCRPKVVNKLWAAGSRGLLGVRLGHRAGGRNDERTTRLTVEDLA